MDVKTIGVIGAGQMGNGIAHVFAAAGFDVRLHDVDAEALARAKPLIEKALEKQVARELLDADTAASSLARIDCVDGVEPIACLLYTSDAADD